MEIELLTTKKKLSKSILNQMPIATFNMDVLNNGECLGYLTNVIKGHHKVILMKRVEEYYIITTGWKVDKYSSTGCILHGTVFRKTFESKEQRESWYKVYHKLMIEPKDHIYI